MSTRRHANQKGTCALVCCSEMVTLYRVRTYTCTHKLRERLRRSPFAGWEGLTREERTRGSASLSLGPRQTALTPRFAPRQVTESSFEVGIFTCNITHARSSERREQVQTLCLSWTMSWPSASSERKSSLSGSIFASKSVRAEHPAEESGKSDQPQVRIWSKSTGR